MLDRVCCHSNVSISIGSIRFRFGSEPPPLVIEAQPAMSGTSIQGGALRDMQRGPDHPEGKKHIYIYIYIYVYVLVILGLLSPSRS